MGTRSLGRQVTEAGWIAPGDGRVGILGGTFDPIHYGHLIIAEQVREALRLDRILFVPAAQPPHRIASEVSPAADRAAMVALAIADNPAFSLCRIELERDGPSYTADTVTALAAELAAEPANGLEATPGPEPAHCPEAAPGPEPAHGPEAAHGPRGLFFILSSEALAGLPGWHEPARVLAACRLAVVARPGTPLPDRGWLERRLPGGASAADRVVGVETVPIANSSSDVRRRVAGRLSIRYLVPPAVSTYICDHRLYTQQETRRTA
jgi:nicotinate-nucleotide adenylyltransferase